MHGVHVCKAVGVGGLVWLGSVCVYLRSCAYCCLVCCVLCARSLSRLAFGSSTPLRAMDLTCVTLERASGVRVSDAQLTVPQPRRVQSPVRSGDSDCGCARPCVPLENRTFLEPRERARGQGRPGRLSGVSGARRV